MIFKNVYNGQPEKRKHSMKVKNRKTCKIKVSLRARKRYKTCRFFNIEHLFWQAFPGEHPSKNEHPECQDRPKNSVNP